MIMDREFPSVLFPSFYNSEPPDTALGHCAGSWGCYGQLRPLTPQTSSSTHRFKAQHEAAGDVWCHTEPVPVPLFSPKHAVLWPSTPANPLDFSEHLQNFFVDHPSDAFGSAAGLLGDKMHFGGRQRKNAPELQDSIRVKKMNHFMDKLKYQACPWTLTSTRVDAYSRLLSDAVHSVPVELLAPLLHEELSLQSLDAAFCEANTGGALELIPFPSSTEGAPQSACLVYCANGVDKLTFQQVALHPGAVVSADEASTFVLKGPVQQISSSSTCGHSCVAVRSLYHCGVWSVSPSQQPHLLQATSSAERVSCVSFSPHVVGELLVASESGAAHLWRLGRGMQLVRSEDSNLYFNGQSPWRWCEFSAHPRVMLYADRTGAELTDIRVQPSSCHTLFRISKGAECRSGERLLLCRYLSPLHSFHHLVTTQYSAYVLDERFPCVPMLKWDHMMDSPPVFCHVLPGSGPSTGAVAKVLLGSQCAQEVMLLQYAGGGAEACVSRGPPQALLRPRDSVERLPAQIPHRTELSRARLTYSATGLTAVHLKRSTSEESFVSFKCYKQETFSTKSWKRPRLQTNHGPRDQSSERTSLRLVRRKVSVKKPHPSGNSGCRN
uniref:TAF1C beta-propeller domain-containing protein n=1 Tax=Neogobius melanostomus TaxID=47308 RepID=A0A8C6TCC7_9GOBI